MKATEIFRLYTWMAEIFFRAGEITLNEFNELWIQTEMSGGIPMIRQTFNRHRQSMQEMFGFNILCNKSRNTYYIAKDDSQMHADMQSRMLDALSISNLIKDNTSLKDQIVMEHTPAGMSHLRSIVNAMKESRQLQVTYRKFGQEEPFTLAMAPYAIKVFKQRWYLLAMDYKRETPSVYALDRIVAVEELDTHFDFPADFSAKAFFQDYYGVYIDPKCEVQSIVIRAYYPYAHYLRTLPLHHSQKELTDTPEYADFELRLRPTFDFKQELLAQAHEVEVLEPASLRKEIKQMVMETMKIYKD